MDATPDTPDAPDASLPPLDDCGFIQVPSTGEALWMTCEQCSKSDHFWLEGGTVRCRCGARYGNAVRPDGTQVPASELIAVPFDQGPVQLADLELDPKRIVILAVLIGALLGGGWWLWG